MSLSRGQMDGDVFIDAGDTEPETLLRRVEADLRAGRQVWLHGGLFQTLAVRAGRRHHGHSWVVVSPRVGGEPHWLYRIRDVVASLLALLALAPVLAVIVLLVKRSSPGPVLYSTTVIGESGRPFTWYKFRSMRPLSPEEDERRRREKFRAFADRSSQPSGEGGQRPEHKVIDESRVTGIGRVLRRYSLDELPQLLNVLKGQMSLVGPRPCLPYEAELFPAWARRRFAVRPGLSGVWQVHGRGRVGFEEALAMDVCYVLTRSFRLDLRLIVQTVAVVLRGEGGR
ncbi:MAG: sugar transferase [Chloroflexi bacterium]|nr:sugar transferase [Chloroflexota bacterium]